MRPDPRGKRDGKRDTGQRVQRVAKGRETTRAIPAEPKVAIVEANPYWDSLPKESR